jgi:hypothetical protein
MIKMSMRGLPEVKAYLSTLARPLKILAVRNIAKYLQGDENHGLRYEPPRVIHNAENPYLWQSERQRKAFFATNGFGGGIPHVRTHETAGGWNITEQDSNWTMVKIVNAAKGAPFVFGDEQQRGHAADGWRKAGQIILDNLKGAIRKAQQEVDKWIKEHNK